ncbi:MAG: LytR C-terminal domain-containing protein [Candidatus Levybacteria bacterium]|nr:LytR C-terminal domain-containing protein [Candidatus Levybacteria bacterium]
MEEISYSGGSSQIRRRISKRLALFGIFFVIILLLLGSVVYFVTRSNSSEKETKSIQLEEDVSPQVTEEEPSPSPKQTEAPTPTPKPKASPTPTTVVSSNPEKANIKVAVQNGSGEAGVAATAADILRKAGYDVVSTGNAQNFDYTDVTITVKAAKKSALTLLEEDLSADYTVAKTSSDLSTEVAYDALVIIGK